MDGSASLDTRWTSRESKYKMLKPKHRTSFFFSPISDILKMARWKDHHGFQNIRRKRSHEAVTDSEIEIHALIYANAAAMCKFLEESNAWFGPRKL